MRKKRCRMGLRVWIITIVLVAACAPPPQAQIPGSQPATSGPIDATWTPFQPLLAGAGSPSASATVPAPTAVETASPTTPESPGPTDTLEPAGEMETPANTPTQAAGADDSPESALTLWVDPRLPAALRNALSLPPDVCRVDSPEGAMLRLEAGGQRPVSLWVYALVTPFPTISQGVSTQALQRAWKGMGGGPFAGSPLLMDESSYQSLATLWGAPAPQSVQVIAEQDLLDRAWKRRLAWAIVPFEALEPRWKVLEVDGQSPIHKDFDPAVYPLVVPISLNGDPTLADALRLVYGETLAPATNRDPARLTVLAMTGVTALVRATAFAMEHKGIRYPAGDVGRLLQEADLTHISNEVPFAEDCPFPDPFQAGMRFCSDTLYIGLLEAVGADIVELTGDHFQDWGVEAMKLTLKLYKERDWLYFGGGANLAEARRAIRVEHNGNRLAFIGCNAKGGSYAQASASHPGAAACGYQWMQKEITRLRSQGYLPIATFQHVEYYTYAAQADQQRDFRGMAQAGAVIVSGSQAHQPQALEFHEGALIHYGLGNLFFDQYDVSLATRQGFIDRHIFYDGRYISAELLPILFIDYARPRPMTPEEGRELLEAVFAASNW
ncbi:MAG: CapA family protein [Anaerolineales bacterium]|nr:CapA family protein [Anaerolineales bacterium]